MECILPVAAWHALDAMYSVVLQKDVYQYSVPLTHGIVTTVSSLYYLWTRHNQFTWTTLKMSRGYFMYDMFHVCRTRQYLYVTHHSLLILFLSFFQRFQLENMFMKSLLLGEITNPLLQLRCMTKNIPKYRHLFPVVNHAFTWLFAVVRGICIPYYCNAFLRDISKDDRVSKKTYRTIAACTVLFNLGNLVWLRGLLRGYWKWIK